MAELAAIGIGAGRPRGASTQLAPVGPRPAFSTTLDQRVADLCAQLAGFLERLPGADGSPLAGGIGLLGELAAGGSAPGAQAEGGALERLVSALDCSPVEIDLIVLAGLAEEHEGLAGLFRMLHPRGEPRPTVGLAAQLFCRSAAERPLLLKALELGPAIRSGAIRLGPPDAPVFERTLEPADGLWLVLRGLDVWPETTGHRSGRAVLAGLDEWLATGPARRGAAAIGNHEAWTILLTGDTEDAALERGVALAEHAGTPWVRLCPAQMTPDLERLIGVHALARGVVPVVRLAAQDGPVTVEAPEFAAHPGPVVIGARFGTPTVRGSRPLAPVPVEPLSAAARRRMWGQLLPGLAPQSAFLAARHLVEPRLAAQAADDVRSVEALERRAGTRDDVIASVRARAGLSLTAGVKLVRPTASWPQLVLPAARLAQLHEAVDRFTHQDRVLDEWGFLAGRRGSRGVRILFSGPPGTGKTLAAEVLAGELGVELLIVDIARVVSKWIGETEKNLAEVFDNAERAQSVLLFDEADALFGKRTDVSDAHDRYANLETAYLLARLERFEGLVILATNLRSNVDAAFTRRLEVVVAFDEPGPGERLAMWRCHVPGDAPLAADVDLEELAALFPVVGGVIRNAAVAAGFLAASDGGHIRRDHFVRAIQREYEKQGRAFPAIPPSATDRGRV
jgi:hypothetical protein